MLQCRLFDLCNCTIVVKHSAQPAVYVVIFKYFVLFCLFVCLSLKLKEAFHKSMGAMEGGMEKMHMFVYVVNVLFFNTVAAKRCDLK